MLIEHYNILYRIIVPDLFKSSDLNFVHYNDFTMGRQGDYEYCFNNFNKVP